MTTVPTPSFHPVAHPAIIRVLLATARVLLGLLFLLTGLNGFLNFLPQPANIPEGAAAFSGALMKTGYMFPLIMITQLIFAVLLLVNRFVPFALVLIAPVIVNIILFHVFLYPGGAAMAIVAVILYGFLLWTYRDSFRSLFTARVRPV
jgi:hypothetical protein